MILSFDRRRFPAWLVPLFVTAICHVSEYYCDQCHNFGPVFVGLATGFFARPL
jgi:hypothetical protein